MSSDKKLFHAPKEYPEPPKNMWYEVPQTKPAVYERPKPIFPWEHNKETRKATRVFLDEYPSEPQPIFIQESTMSFPKRDDPHAPHEQSPITPGTPTIKITHSDPWDAFPRTNAWDSSASIDQYVRALRGSQSRRTVQVIHQSGTTSPAKRRESLILTDFPTEIDRPSLPVTPAPIRRPTFWGNERDESGELPAAEGVPEQADWVCPNCGFPIPNDVLFPGLLGLRRFHNVNLP